MALQSSGAISISQIKTELSSSSNSLRALSSAAGKSTPDAMSEFYGYSAYVYVPPLVIYGFSDQGDGATVYGNGYSNDPYYFEEVNPGPYQGQLTSWSTEYGNTINYPGSYYPLTVTYVNLGEWTSYIIPYDANGYLTGNYYWNSSIPITHQLPTNSRGFMFGHQGETPYTFAAQFYLGT